MALKYPVDVSNDYILSTSLGNNSDAFKLIQSGDRQLLSQLAFETVWGAGQALGNLQYLTSGERMSLVSTSIEDAPGGSGADTVLIFATGANNEFVQEEVTLNGTTPVLTVNPLTVINDAFVVGGDPDSFGSAGDITFTAEVTGTIQEFMCKDTGRTTGSFFRVPDAFNASALSIIMSTGKNDEVVLIPYVRSNPDSAWLGFSPIKTDSSTTQIVNLMQGFGAGSDLQIRAKGITPNADISVALNLYVENVQNIRPIT